MPTSKHRKKERISDADLGTNDLLTRNGKILEQLVVCDTLLSGSRGTEYQEAVGAWREQLLGMLAINRGDLSAKAAGEPTLWAVKVSIVEKALDFWNSFLVLRMGKKHDKPLDAWAKGRLLKIFRAVSWVESAHGTVGANQPARDPMQCGNPADMWWRELVGATATDDRFVGGPDATNYYARELPAAVAKVASCPDDAKLTKLADVTQGHTNDAFNATMSYYWGIPYLIHRTNKTAGRKTYQCQDLSRSELIAGAVAYNGQGVPDYRTRIEKALALCGDLTD